MPRRHRARPPGARGRGVGSPGSITNSSPHSHRMVSSLPGYSPAGRWQCSGQLWCGNRIMSLTASAGVSTSTRTCRPDCSSSPSPKSLTSIRASSSLLRASPMLSSIAEARRRASSNSASVALVGDFGFATGLSSSYPHHRWVNFGPGQSAVAPYGEGGSGPPAVSCQPSAIGRFQRLLLPNYW